MTSSLVGCCVILLGRWLEVESQGWDLNRLWFQQLLLSSVTWNIESLVSICLSLFQRIVFICLKGKVTETEGRTERASNCWFALQMASKGLGRLKPGSRSFTQVAHVVARGQALRPCSDALGAELNVMHPGHKLEPLWMLTGSLMCNSTMLTPA